LFRKIRTLLRYIWELRKPDIRKYRVYFFTVGYWKNRRLEVVTVLTNPIFCQPYQLQEGSHGYYTVITHNHHLSRNTIINHPERLKWMISWDDGKTFHEIGYLTCHVEVAVDGYAMGFNHTLVDQLNKKGIKFTDLMIVVCQD